MVVSLGDSIQPDSLRVPTKYCCASGLKILDTLCWRLYTSLKTIDIIDPLQISSGPVGHLAGIIETASFDQ